MSGFKHKGNRIKRLVFPFKSFLDLLTLGKNNLNERSEIINTTPLQRTVTL